MNRIIKKFRQLVANTSWNRKRKYLINCGAHIGNGTRINCTVKMFGTEPYLIKIGDDCLIADEVHFITHDGGVKVLNTLGYFENERMDNIAPIIIGDNVYIGTGAYIMPGVRIGNNAIIGAGAIVTHDIEDNVIAVGIPAKAIESVEDYYLHSMRKGRLRPTANMGYEEKKEFYKNMYSNAWQSDSETLN